MLKGGGDGKFAAIYGTFMPLEIFEVHFDCAGSQPAGPKRVPFKLSGLVIIFRGRHKGGLVLLSF